LTATAWNVAVAAETARHALDPHHRLKVACRRGMTTFRGCHQRRYRRFVHSAVGFGGLDAAVRLVDVAAAPAVAAVVAVAPE